MTARQGTASEQTDEVSELLVSFVLTRTGCSPTYEPTARDLVAGRTGCPKHHTTGYAAPVVSAQQAVAEQTAAEHTDMPRPCARPDQARKPTDGGLDGAWS